MKDGNAAYVTIPRSSACVTVSSTTRLLFNARPGSTLSRFLRVPENDKTLSTTLPFSFYFLCKLMASIIVTVMATAICEEINCIKEDIISKG